MISLKTEMGMPGLMAFLGGVPELQVVSPAQFETSCGEESGGGAGRNYKIKGERER